MAELITNGGFTGNDNGWDVGSGWAYDINKESYTVSDTGSIVFISGISSGTSSGYTIGDILTFDEDGDANAQVEVLSVDEMTGEINNWRIVNIGSGYTPGSFLNASGGSGTGAQFFIAFVGTLALSQTIAVVNNELYNYAIDVTIGPTEQTMVVMRYGPDESNTQDVAFFSNTDSYSGELYPTTDNGKLFIYGAGGPFFGEPPWTGSVDNVSVTGEEGGPGKYVDHLYLSDNDDAIQIELFPIFIHNIYEAGDDIFIEEDIQIEVTEAAPAPNEFEVLSISENLIIDIFPEIEISLKQVDVPINEGTRYRLSFDLDISEGGLLSVFQGSQRLYYSILDIDVGDDLVPFETVGRERISYISKVDNLTITEDVTVAVV